jgi:hypothetical protein
MSTTVVEKRPRTRPRPPTRLGLRSESLESRRLLDAAQPIVAPNLSVAIGLPVPSLETGTDLAAVESSPINLAGSEFATGFVVLGTESVGGLATPNQTLSSFQAGVSVAPITTTFPPLSSASTAETSFGSSATGPAPTLKPPGTDLETAVAAASQVAQPTPGTSDRISNLVVTPLIIPLPHFRPPDLGLANPRLKPHPPAKVPAPPVQPQAQPTTPEVPKAAEPKPEPAPVRPNDVEPVPVPKAPPAEPREPISLQAWDTALGVVAADLPDGLPVSMAFRMEESIAVGALLAAWAGWSRGLRLEGRSRRQPLSVSLPTLESGPGDGSGR